MARKSSFNPSLVLALCVVLAVIFLFATPIVCSQTAAQVGNGTPASGVPLFQSPIAYDSGGHSPQAVALADVNGDGKPDMIVTNACTTTCDSGSVGVLLGNGDGTFHSPISYPSGGYLPTSVVVTDMNYDGKLDIVVANYSRSLSVFRGSLGVLLGNGDGTFQRPLVSPSGAYYATAMAENRYSWGPHLVVAHWNGGVGFGGGDIRDFSGTHATAIAVGDFNHDGLTDVVVVETPNAGGPPSVAVRLSIGHHGILQPTAIYPTGGAARAVAVADVNHDGNFDLVVGNFTDRGHGSIGILLGNNDGTFQPVKICWNGGGINAVAIADVDRDGSPDVIATILDANFQPDAIGVLLGNGDGSFQPPLLFSAGGFTTVYSTASLAIADLSLDEGLDLAVAASPHGNAASVLLNNMPPYLATSATLLLSPNPSVFGQAIRLTATVVSDASVPPGTVDFMQGSSLLGSADLVNGSASIPLASFAAGSSFAAQYQGGLQFKRSQSIPVNQSVTPATSSISLTSSSNPARCCGASFTARVVGQYGGPVTGKVAFQKGGTPLGTVYLSNGSATIQPNLNDPPGSYMFTAQYLGDLNNIPSAFATLNQVFQQATILDVSSSASPAFVGQPVTLTAALRTWPSVNALDGELVAIYDGNALLGKPALKGGIASLTTSALTFGGHGIKAIYAGDKYYWSSHTQLMKQVIVKYPTTTSLSSNLNPSKYGQRVTFTAQVQSSGPASATGKVTFKDGTTSIGIVALNGGTATLPKSRLALGTHPITVEYWGDSASGKSASAIVNQVVQ